MGFHKSIAGMGWISLVPEGANPNPVDLAIVSGMTFNVEESDVDLRGEDPDIVDSFTGERTISGDMQTSDFSASLLKLVTSGVTVATGQTLGAAHSGVIPTTPFAITVPQSATFTVNCGVTNLTSGKTMKVVASAPATGEYSFAAGVYTFAAADTGNSVLIRYKYTATTGVTAEIAAATATASPKCQIHVVNERSGVGIYVPSARVSGLGLALKANAWSDVSLKWKAVKSSAGKMLYVYGGKE